MPRHHPPSRRARVAVRGLVAAGLLLGLAASSAPAGRCARPAANEAVLGWSDFHWQYTPAEMHARFEEIYAGHARLRRRAWYDPARGVHVLPYVNGDVRGEVVLEPELVATVRDHIETALEAGLADHVFMPDMGHAHLLVRQALYEERLRPLGAREMPAAYAIILADPQTRFVYHAAEQLQVLDDARRPIDDDYLHHRLATRSLVGGRTPGSLRPVAARDDPHNTLRRAPPGYRWWGSGFDIGANRHGCFAYDDRGRTRRFDISLDGLSSDPHEAPLAMGGAAWRSPIGAFAR